MRDDFFWSELVRFPEYARERPHKSEEPFSLDKERSQEYCDTEHDTYHNPVCIWRIN